MQSSTVMYSDIIANSDSRIDAEYYHPIVLKMHKNIKKKGAILFYSKVHKISSGKNLDQNHGGRSKFIRTQNIDSILIDDNGMSFTDSLDGLEPLKEGDLIFVRVGAHTGYNSIVMGKYANAAFSDNILRLRIKGINPYFCSAFFNSRMGYRYFKRVLKGTARDLISQENFKEILIPFLKEDFQFTIQHLIESSYSFLEEARKNYKTAENLLFKHLNLANWQAEDSLFFTRNFSEVVLIDRFDAEHLQPKYQKIIDSIKEYRSGFTLLKELLTIKDKNFEPKHDKEYRYIEVADIASNGWVSGCSKGIGKELPTRARRRVNQGDVIISSIEGSLESVALISEKWDRALCSNGFFVVSSSSINSETLFIFMKSKAGQMQLKQSCRGAILSALRKEDFAKILIPKFDTDFQAVMKEKVSKMYEAQNKSKRLIETATRGVEIAIEEDEKAAEKWIHSELDKLNITI